MLVRSLWRADVRLERWQPGFEMTGRRLVPAAEALRLVTAAEPAMAPFYRWVFVEAAAASAEPPDRPDGRRR